MLRSAMVTVMGPTRGTKTRAFCTALSSKFARVEKFRHTALGLISFGPFVGLAVFPLQAIAWFVRGMLFQYLGLTALGSYLTLYRGHA